MANPSITAAHAKLNLFLHITGRRADGYHTLSSLVTFARDLTDHVSIAASDTLSLTVDGEFSTASGDTETNLVLRAARLLRAHTGHTDGAAIALSKHIPVGAGLGGGSADAAAALHALNDHWNCGMSDTELLALAPTLGADVAMCLASKPLLAQGVGEVITVLPQPMPTLHAVLVHPCIPLLSADVYRALDSINTAVIEDAVNHDALNAAMASTHGLITYLKQARNDLQRAAIAVCPTVAELLLAMETALPAPALVRMTGSGACCFALFDDAHAANRYAQTLHTTYPHWWVRVSAL